MEKAWRQNGRSTASKTKARRQEQEEIRAGPEGEMSGQEFFRMVPGDAESRFFRIFTGSTDFREFSSARVTSHKTSTLKHSLFTHFPNRPDLRSIRTHESYEGAMQNKS